MDRYDFEGPTRFDKLLTGIVSARAKGLGLNDRAGTEDIGPEDTFDGDYGRLLDRVANRAEGVASPRGTEKGRKWRPTTFVVGVAA